MGWLTAFVVSSIGRKVIVAVSGLLMFLFVTVHMLGNLQVFGGRELFNHYAELLRIEPPLLWTFRVGMLLMLIIHIITTVVLTLENRAARPVAYGRLDTIKATFASRTMIWGGILLASFITYHLLHLTFGSAHPGLFDVHDPYGNVVGAFQNPATVAVYFVGLIALFFHLTHGFQSAFETIGVGDPKYLPIVKALGTALAVLIVLGYASVPVSVLLGIVA